MFVASDHAEAFRKASEIAPSKSYKWSPAMRAYFILGSSAALWALIVVAFVR